MDKPEFKYASLSDIGLVRKVNEDYCDSFESPAGQVFVVCDGMGGHAGGDIASQTAVEAVRNYYKNEMKAGINQSIHEAIEAANEAILKKVADDPSLNGMGTTIVVLLIKDSAVYFGHAGDSRLYYFHNNELKQLTKDHSYVQTLVDRGLLTEEQAENHPRKNQITKALGISELAEPDICREPIQPVENDCFLLCSDGLSGMVSTGFIKSILSDKRKSLQQKAEQLIAEANNNGGKDNITVQIIEFEKHDKHLDSKTPVYTTA